MKFFQQRINVFLIIFIINVVVLISSNTNINIISRTILTSTNFFRTSIAHTVSYMYRLGKSIQTNRQLQQENARLRNAIIEYQMQYKSLDALLFENQRLRELLQFSYSIDFNLLPTSIISTASANGTISYMIDKGSRHGVKNNMIVCAIYNNRLILLGQVTVTHRRTAIFRDIHEKGFSLPVITSDSNQIGILSGQGIFKNSLLAIFDDLYQGKKIHVGEEVSIQKYSKFFPQGIPIGYIKNITTSTTDTLFRAEVESFTKIQNEQIVFILIPKAEKL